MGHLVEKYTKEYFTGLNADGSELEYGILGDFNAENTTLRAEDVMNLNRVDFNGSHVLEIGFGRGESIKYIMEKGAATYVGVDFSPAAYELAQQYLKIHALTAPRIYCEDALAFIEKNKAQLDTIDLVVLLDVVEHIPRDELSMLLLSLKKYLSKKAILVLNTPVYRYDNDVIANGLDERNHIDAIDHSDFFEETKGMHCNKYSIHSLPVFMKKLGFIHLTEYQIYANCHPIDPITDWEREYAYALLWHKAGEKGYPIHPTYVADVLEYAYNRKLIPKLIPIIEEPMQGCRFLGDQIAHTLPAESIFFFKQNIPPGSVIFDVGAYIGLFSLLFSKLTGEEGAVICFEPNKYNMLRLKKNISLNPDLVNNISFYGFGLSDKNDQTQMLLSDEIENGYASGSQLSRGGFTAMPKSTLIEMGFFEEQITTKTLDAFVKQAGIIPDVIKVDIEGAELLFLQGGIQTLIKHKPILFIELHNSFTSCFILSLLWQIGYHIEILSEEAGDRVQMVATVNQASQSANLLSPQLLQTLCNQHTLYKNEIQRKNLDDYVAKKKSECDALIAEMMKLPVQLENQNQLVDKVTCMMSHLSDYYQLMMNMNTQLLQLEKVSIIIPTYNRAKFIEAAVRSVLVQTYKNIEILVIDDGSTDNTQEIISQIIDPRLIYISRAHQGSSHARNYGLQIATGYYITFLDSDDLYLPNKIALQVEHLKNNSHIGLLYTSAHLIDDNGRELPEMYKASCSGCVYEHVAFFTPETITLPTVMTYKSIIEKVGRFDENMHRFEDTDLWRRIAKNYRIEALEESTCLLRTHQENALKSQNPKDIVNALEYYAKKILQEDTTISKSIKKAGLCRLYVYYAKAFMTLPKHRHLTAQLMGIAAKHRLGINPYGNGKNTVSSFLLGIAYSLYIYRWR